MTSSPTAADPPPTTPDGGGNLVGSAQAGPAALRGSVMLGGGYAATIGLSLISVPLLVRHLGYPQFGRYTTIVALVTIVNGLTDAGVSNIALREWSASRGASRADLMRSLLAIRVVLSLAGVAAGVAFAIIAGYDVAFSVGTLIAGAGMVLTAVANLLMVSLQGELRFGWVTIINVVRQAVATALVVGLVLVGAGLLPLLASGSIAGLVTLVFAAVLVRGHMPLRPRWRGALWWPLVRDTLPYGAAIAVNTLYFRITIVVMSLAAGALQTGYFATSFRVIEVLIGVPALAIGAAFPILSRAAADDQDRFAYAAARIIELSTIAGIGLALLISLTAPIVIAVLAGPQGAPAAAVLQIQAIAIASTFLTMANGFVLLSLRRHAVLLISNSAALIANVALTLVLVPLAQAQGAAVAAVIAETALALGTLIAVVRAPQTAIDLGPLGAVLIAGCAGATPLLLGSLPSALRAVVGLLVYLAVLGLFKRIPPELMHVLPLRRGRAAGS